MINLGVKYLLPSNYKAFDWINSNIEFESNTWVSDTLKLLNDSNDVSQLFSHCIDMKMDKTTSDVYQSFGYNYNKNNPYKLNYWHSGFGWAMTRKCYEKLEDYFKWVYWVLVNYFIERKEDE